MRRRSVISTPAINNIRSPTVINPIYFQYNTDLVSKEAFDLHILLYNNYIKNINNQSDSFTIDSYSLNAIRLHELFLENITNKTDIPNDMDEFFATNFTSKTNWKENFINICKSIHGNGWCCAVYDKITNSFRNIAIKNHANGMLIDCKPIIILDVFEHAWIIDYGTDKIKYIENFIDRINWQTIKERIDGLSL